jgi:hypothetical protein
MPYLLSSFASSTVTVSPTSRPNFHGVFVERDEVIAFTRKREQLNVSTPFKVQTTRRRLPLNPKSETFALGTRRICQGGSLS